MSYLNKIVKKWLYLEFSINFCISVARQSLNCRYCRSKIETGPRNWADSPEERGERSICEVWAQPGPICVYRLETWATLQAHNTSHQDHIIITDFIFDANLWVYYYYYYSLLLSFQHDIISNNRLKGLGKGTTKITFY